MNLLIFVGLLSQFIFCIVCDPVKLGLLTVTHARNNIDYSVFSAYLKNYVGQACYHDLISEINIVWNNQKSPEEAKVIPKQQQSITPVHFYKTKTNSMNHRYHLTNNSIADVIYSVDDDIMSGCEVINKTFQIYKRLNKQIVGTVVTHEVRSYEFTPGNNEQLTYQGSANAKYFAIVQPGASFYPRQYLDLYYLNLNEVSQFHEAVDKVINCDDIFFASLIEHFYPQFHPYYDKPAPQHYKNTDPKIGNSRTNGIMNIRAGCLKSTLEILGYNPLRLYHKNYSKYINNWQYPNLKQIIELRKQGLKILNSNKTSQKNNSQPSKSAIISEQVNTSQLNLNNSQNSGNDTQYTQNLSKITEVNKTDQTLQTKVQLKVEQKDNKDSIQEPQYFSTEKLILAVLILIICLALLLLVKFGKQYFNTHNVILQQRQMRNLDSPDSQDNSNYQE